VGIYITLLNADGAAVRNMPDPFGGTFDASGDFDDLLGQGASPLLDGVDYYGVTTLASSEMSALAMEVDALLATIPERARVPGRTGKAWRGLTRFRVMVGLCATDSRFTIKFVGD
jgi:hypothetical protein